MLSYLGENDYTGMGTSHSIWSRFSRSGDEHLRDRSVGEGRWGKERHLK